MSEKIEKSIRFATIALGTYQKITGSDDDTMIRDLLADLRHLSDVYAIDWDEELRIGMDNYQAEKEGIY